MAPQLTTLALHQFLATSEGREMLEKHTLKATSQAKRVGGTRLGVVQIHAKATASPELKKLGGIHVLPRDKTLIVEHSGARHPSLEKLSAEIRNKFKLRGVHHEVTVVG